MIDWRRVEELRTEMTGADFDEVVDTFLQEVEDALVRLAATEDANERAVVAHFLKGAGLNLGLVEFSALCRQAELGIHSAGVEDLAAAYDTARTALLCRLGRSDPGAKPS